MDRDAANLALCEALAIDPEYFWVTLPSGSSEGRYAFSKDHRRLAAAQNFGYSIKLDMPKLYEWAGTEKLIAAMRGKGHRISEIEDASFIGEVGAIWRAEFQCKNRREAGTLPMAVFLAACAAFGIEVEA